MSKSAIVVKSVGGVFAVMDGQGKKTVCYSPKKFRFKDSDVIIGDAVLFDPLKNGKGVITEVLPRKNKLARPEIANVDVCFIVAADEPAPDFYLVDKVLINCFQEKIYPVIVVNKSDLSDKTLLSAQEDYGSVADIVSVSAFDGSASVLKKYLDGKTACFAGQSAVGKTSLLNALLPEAYGEIGALSLKTGRGMHTTRHATLHRAYGGFIADTCGFSLCDLAGIRSDELRLYLDDMVELSRDCRYGSCTHTVEPDCAVRSAVKEGKLSEKRYNRYVEEYNELCEFEKNQY
ncbi:MAG: ribosome small subunit-dependent GTPase A [Corallococcus sp.]|nr:ribosome small subunit-dependent GTPase A [Bacillota bacterium]MCM1533557.1 ribosome small subunit-dependent GTPase A [Corallococcus sp.]